MAARHGRALGVGCTLLLYLTVMSLLWTVQADDPRARPGGAASTSQNDLSSQGSDAPYANRAAVVSWVVVCVVCIFSLFVSTTGIVVAQQYPRPHCLCWQQYCSDVAGARGCCSLYRSNVGLAMVWVLFSTIMAITRTLPSMAVAIGFTLLHLMAVYMLRNAFRRHGFPMWSTQHLVLDLNQAGRNRTEADDLESAAQRLQLAAAQPSPHATVAGVPIYNIPLIRAEVGPVDAQADKCKCSTCQQYELLDMWEAYMASGGADMAALPVLSSSTVQGGGQRWDGQGAAGIPVQAEDMNSAGIGRFRGGHADMARHPDSITDQRHGHVQIGTAGSGSGTATGLQESGSQGQPVIAHPVHHSLLLVSGTPVGPSSRLQRVSTNSQPHGELPASSMAGTEGGTQWHVQQQFASQDVQRMVDAHSIEVRLQLSRTVGRQSLPPEL